MRTVYLNGEYLPEDQAKVSIFDRGFLFADSVYEVTAVLDGKLVDFYEHMDRLKRSLNAIELGLDLSAEEILEAHRQLIQENNLAEGLIYLQVSRGNAERDFLFPDKSQAQPSVVMFSQEKKLLNNPLATKGLKVVTFDDLRWQRCDIKSTQLLYSSLAKTRAIQAGADDCWLVRDGVISEGSSSNAFIVTANNEILTHPGNHKILSGITRAALMECADKLSLKIIERPFAVKDVKNAIEAFSTSSSSFVLPMVEIDGVMIGDGTLGQVFKLLRETYIQLAQKRSI